LGFEQGIEFVAAGDNVAVLILLTVELNIFGKLMRFAGLLRSRKMGHELPILREAVIFPTFEFAVLLRGKIVEFTN